MKPGTHQQTKSFALQIVAILIVSTALALYQVQSASQTEINQHILQLQKNSYAGLIEQLEPIRLFLRSSGQKPLQSAINKIPNEHILAPIVALAPGTAAILKISADAEVIWSWIDDRFKTDTTAIMDPYRLPRHEAMNNHAKATTLSGPYFINNQPYYSILLNSTTNGELFEIIWPADMLIPHTESTGVRILEIVDQHITIHNKAAPGAINSERTTPFEFTLSLLGHSLLVKAILTSQNHRWLLNPVLTFLGSVNLLSLVLLIYKYNQLTHSKPDTETTTSHSIIHTDILTGTANRLCFFSNLLQQMSSDTSRFNIITIRIGDFRQVNESLGIASGDTTLITTSMRLRALIDTSDLLARLGDKEFIILLQNKNPEFLQKTLEKIKAALNNPITVAGMRVYINFQIGCAGFPQDGHTIDSLINSALVPKMTIKP